MQKFSSKLIIKRLIVQGCSTEETKKMIKGSNRKEADKPRCRILRRDRQMGIEKEKRTGRGHSLEQRDVQSDHLRAMAQRHRRAGFYREMDG